MAKQLTILVWGAIYGEVIGYVLSAGRDCVRSRNECRHSRNRGTDCNQSLIAFR